MLDIVIIALGGIGSAVLPYIAYQYAGYKTKKRGKGPVSYPLAPWMLFWSAWGFTINHKIMKARK